MGRYRKAVEILLVSPKYNHPAKQTKNPKIPYHQRIIMLHYLQNNSYNILCILPSLGSPHHDVLAAFPTPSGNSACTASYLTGLCPLGFFPSSSAKLPHFSNVNQPSVSRLFRNLLNIYQPMLKMKKDCRLIT